MKVMKHIRSRVLTPLAIILSAVAATANLSAQTPETVPVSITQIFKRAHPEAKDREVIVQRIELAPGASPPPHVHPGMVTGYVISGSLDFQVEGEPLLHLKAGDTFFEAPGSKHLVARNTDKKEKAVLIAFVINPKDQDVAQPMKGH